MENLWDGVKGIIGKDDRTVVLVKPNTLECAYLEGKVKLRGEHKRYFWAAIDSISRLIFNRNFLRNFKFTYDSFHQSTIFPGVE